MSQVIGVDPFRCRMWSGHERLEECISVETCRAEISSVSVHGQRLPALGRRLEDDATHDFELIYGARRLFVARHLHVPLLLEVRALTDLEAVIALDIENRQRKDFSPYERARSFNGWLRAGLFSSQDELAKTLNISSSQVSRVLNLAKLPSVLLSAFACPTEICERWGHDLMELWKDPEGRKLLTAGARALGAENPRPRALVVYQRLMGSPNKRRNSRQSIQQLERDEVVNDEGGKPLFRISVRRRDVAILLPSGLISSGALGEIKRNLAEILQRARVQPIEKMTNLSPSTTRLTIRSKDSRGTFDHARQEPQAETRADMP